MDQNTQTPVTPPPRVRKPRRQSEFVAFGKVPGEDDAGPTWEIVAEGASVEACQRKITQPDREYIFCCVHLRAKPVGGGLVWPPKRKR